jgi:DNA-binding response OmpR family regulator
VVKVLTSEPFDVRSFSDGLEAFHAIEAEKPDVVLLDVALPSMFGFEVCENIRRDPSLAAVKTILIAAIYDKTRYKRTPASLYGADDYIEKHHIPDDLAAKIYRLTAGQQQEEPKQEEPKQEEPKQEEPKQEDVPLFRGEPASPTPQEALEQQQVRQELQQMEVAETTAPPVAPPVDTSEGHMKARRFARIIVSDIVLYNQAKVEQGVRQGTFYELLADDIQEGRAIYAQRVAEEIRTGTAYLDEALADLVAKKQREYNS